MIPLPVLTLGTKVAILCGAILLTATASAYLTWKYTAADLELYIANANVAVMKQTVEVVKLDEITLRNALELQRKQLEKDREIEIRWNTIKETDHVITAAECTISPDSLRLWNDENRGVSN